MKVIIIGAGIGGLTAGNILVKNGCTVKIFESHFNPGGYTAGFYRKGFYFESGTDAFEMSSMIFPIMKKIGVYDKINFHRLEPYNQINNTFTFFPSTYQEYKETIISQFTNEAVNLQKYFKEIDEVYGAMKGFFTPSKNKILSKIINGPKIGLFFLKYGRVSVSSYVQKFFPKESQLYKTLCSIVPYPNSSAINLGGALWTIFHDYWTVKSGMQSWATILADKFIENSGDLHLKTRVDQIKFKDKKAIGVTANGVFYEADIIISAMDYKKTLQMIGSEIIPTEMIATAEKTRVSPSYFVVYLGLNMDNEELREHLKSSHTIVYDDSHELNINHADDISFFRYSRLTIYSPSLINEELAPNNKSSIMLTTFSPYNWAEKWDKVRDTVTYKQLKEDVKNVLVSRLEEIIPGITDKIEFQDSATPFTFERYTHNTNGATNAWGLGSENQFYRNTLKVHIHTPVENLYIGSAWAAQVGGVPFAVKAGNDCAEEILKKCNLKKT